MSAKCYTHGLHLAEIIPCPHEALGGLEGRKFGPKTGFEFFRKANGYVESKLFQWPENTKFAA